ncbi:cobyrinate a,c-diamide synthase [Nitratireductor sp. StC3]|uniref:cobyrinate a,c-diamide synthase n=1 Tax=Nitratireductor sp. StC3 TaxID=2126741 RepID=UPI000D0DA267|nr:cobyrinate a,c-diamide synthase [Nitratireductor sp. StC3]PSM17190.1 cobyrinic acid a,c-diamide synthase [Nitratireductor sp. StC3]
MTARALIIGAARSGSGKTSVTIGLLRALSRRGIAVRGAKSGPDYIDPGFHAAATGRPGVNLDSWAMPPALLDALTGTAAHGGDLVIVESAMGLFDGIRAEPGRTGAASDLARRYGVPVLLVLDVSGQSQTAAAIARGFASHDPQVRIAGVILNQVASPRHETYVREALEDIGIEVVGVIYRNPEMTLPERHLGLVQASEHAAIDAFIERLADTMEKSIDLDRVMDLAGPFAPASDGDAAANLPPPGQRVAIARDAAFSFVYPHVLAAWHADGVDILPFSPLADEAPDETADACWLPGGYPELHAAQLGAATRFRDGMHAFAATRPVHGECGGFMVLGRAIEDADGAGHAMLGLLGHETSFAKRKINLGYRQARLRCDCAIGRAGDTVRGHEFHYARVTQAGDDEALADIADGAGNPLGLSGARRGTVTGTFFHAIARA